MEYLKNTRNLLAIIDKEVDGIKFEASDRNRVSGALFFIALDHAKAIVVLLENNIYASVYALARPIFESLVRAAWVRHCASDGEIAPLIKKDEFKLNFGQMLDAVEKKCQWEETLTQLKRGVWKSMHSFTHGGIQLISRRFKGESLEPNYDEREIIGLLKLVALISFLSFTEIVGMSGTTNEKEKVLHQLYDSMCSWCLTSQ